MLFDKELERVIDDQSYLDQEVKSVYHPEPEQEEGDSTETAPILVSEEAESLVKRIDDIEKLICVLIERLKRLEAGEENPVTTPVTDQTSTEDVPVTVARQLKVKQGTKKLILLSDDTIIKEFPYLNAIEKRKAKKQAEKHLLQLQKG